MKCPHCKTEIPAGYRFCHSCGKDIRPFWKADLNFELSRYFNTIDTVFPGHIIDVAHWNKDLDDYSAGMAEKAGYDRVLDFFHAFGYQVIDSNKIDITQKRKNIKRKKGIKTEIAAVSALVAGIVMFGLCLFPKLTRQSEEQDRTIRIEPLVSQYFTATETNENITDTEELNMLILSRDSYEIGKIDDDSVELTITAPDMYSMFKEAVDNNYSSSEMLQTLISRLKSGNYDTVISDVRLEIAENNGSLEIKETEEFANAVYGNMMKFFDDYSK